MTLSERVVATFKLSRKLRSQLNDQMPEADA